MYISRLKSSAVLVGKTWVSHVWHMSFECLCLWTARWGCQKQRAKNKPKKIVSPSTSTLERWPFKVLFLVSSCIKCDWDFLFVQSELHRGLRGCKFFLQCTQSQLGVTRSQIDTHAWHFGLLIVCYLHETELLSRSSDVFQRTSCIMSQLSTAMWQVSES